jgi:hypothetical protein
MGLALDTITADAVRIVVPLCCTASAAKATLLIPDDLVPRVVAFSTEGPGAASDLNEDLLALDAGYHVGTTTLYGRQ